MRDRLECFGAESLGSAAANASSAPLPKDWNVKGRPISDFAEWSANRLTFVALKDTMLERPQEGKSGPIVSTSPMRGLLALVAIDRS